jgi:hypothetical protein
VTQRTLALGLALPALALFPGTGAPHSGPVSTHFGPGQTAAHELHESYADLAIDRTTVGGRIQFFRSDLERALGPLANADAVTLIPGDQANALVLRYLRDHLTFSTRGDTLLPAILRSAVIELGHHEGWEVTLSWEAAATIDSLRVRNTLLFELHEDQRNIMRFVRFPEETRETRTFEASTPEAVILAH